MIDFDVTNIILKYLHGQLDVKDLPETCIVLDQKIKELELMSNFRSISLCNVIYTAISKVLVNMIKSILQGVIDESQSAFVSNRLITDNIIVAMEDFHWFNHESQSKYSKYIAIKANMSKAYDRIEWTYLCWILQRMRFLECFCNLIMRYVATVYFQVLINRVLSQKFLLSRDLRQGDHMSPYLFILCVKCLSCLIKEAVDMHKLYHIFRHKLGYN